MELSFHLCFSGQCEAAFRFYERTLGGTLSLHTYGETPAASTVPAGWKDKIVHATLTVGDRRLAGADVLPDQYEAPRGFFVLVNPSTPAEAERIFTALAQNGSVRMPLQQTFWSAAFGVLVDQFGIPWEVSCEASP
jgi:PhnB protein